MFCFIIFSPNKLFAHNGWNKTFLFVLFFLLQQLHLVIGWAWSLTTEESFHLTETANTGPMWVAGTGGNWFSTPTERNVSSALQVNWLFLNRSLLALSTLLAMSRLGQSNLQGPLSKLSTQQLASPVAVLRRAHWGTRCHAESESEQVTGLQVSGAEALTSRSPSPCSKVRKPWTMGGQLVIWKRPLRVMHCSSTV